MVRHFGYIEGYYGKMLSWDERFALCGCLEQLSLNTYLYAPKEDPWHRKEWKVPYPQRWIETFRRFVTHASKNNVHVVPALSPGLSFDYTSSADYHTLLKKMSVFADAGVSTVALLMDDIPDSLPKKCAKSFSSLGQAHGKLLSRLQIDLQKRLPGLSLWFCPTIYTDLFAKEGIGKSRYLNDLAVSMPGTVAVLWTGPGVISEKLDKKSISEVSRMFNDNIILWDNMYAIDYCPHRLFAGPYLGRKHDVLEVTKGILLNPTGMPHTDSLLLALLSAFVRKVSGTQAWKKALSELPVADEFLVVSRFFDLPFTRITPADFAKPKFLLYQKALRRLVWDWKSPLQREWYPFLYMLDTDLRLLQKKAGSAEAEKWINKKYPPVLSKLLLTGAGAAQGAGA
jgi:protein O-GlcNAcase/histone acetyltransferase